MFVTLEVSKLSGWLNADAYCRESKGGHTVLGEVCPGRRKAADGRSASSVEGRARLQIGGRARGGAHPEHAVHGCDAGRVEAQRLVERRRALPRVERRAYNVGRGAKYRERPEAAGDCGARGVQGRTRLQIGSRARGGAHPEHLVHVRDAGGVEAQRLVERRRGLQRVKRRAYGVGRGAGYREAGGGGRPRCTRGVQGRARLQIGGRARGGAHKEHLVHVRDAGGVPVGYVRVENPQVFEEVAHVGDGRDVPVGEGAVRRSGGSRVRVVRLDRRLQGGRGRECGEAGPRTPARAISSRGKGRGARPRATDEQLVGIGQGVCVLCGVAWRAHGAGQGAAREAGSSGRPRRTQRASEGATAE
eukprot:scaffold7370_cov57-Phaeocystis_antarctica.AAC.5